jgi:hypothetical protein
MGDDVLELYAIYDHPRDYPEEFVARRWRVRRGLDMALADTGPPNIRGKTLDEVRRQLPAGLVCLDRFAEDDPVIVETWL